MCAETRRAATRAARCLHPRRRARGASLHGYRLLGFLGCLDVPLVAALIGDDRVFLLALERPRVLAVLRVVLAGDERAEEATLGHELAAAVGAALTLELGEIVRRGNQLVEIALVERRGERRVELV